MAAALLASIGAAPQAAASAAAFEKVLVPLYLPQPRPGANGSLWTTEVWLRNSGNQPVAVEGYDAFLCSMRPCPATLPPTPPVPPGFSFRPLLFPGAAGFREGTFLFVEQGRLSDVDIHLRAQDQSRQSSTRGAEVPVVPESEFRRDRIVLADISLSENFRHVLRVYGLDGSRSGDVLLRVYGINPSARTPAAADALLGQATLRVHAVPPGLSANAAYGAFTDLRSIAGTGFEQVLVILEPITPDFPIWAFVGVVHNETQHLTVISPQ